MSPPIEGRQDQAKTYRTHEEILLTFLFDDETYWWDKEWGNLQSPAIYHATTSSMGKTSPNKVCEPTTPDKKTPHG